MVGAMGVILEIAVVRVLSVCGPVVGHTDVQSTDVVCQGEVYLLRVVRVGQSHTTPCRERQALVCYAKGGLKRHVAKVLTTPDVLTHYIRCHGGFQLVFWFLCLLCRSGQCHCQQHERDDVFLHNSAMLFLLPAKVLLCEHRTK